MATAAATTVSDPIDDSDLADIISSVGISACDMATAAAVTATTTPCWELPADDGSMPAEARAGNVNDKVFKQKKG